MSVIKLYHGGELPVNEPKPQPPALTRSHDFGFGFYTTTSKDQAKRWVQIRIRQQVYATGVVSCYEFDTKALSEKGLKVKSFDGPTAEWFDFVMSNRHDASFTHDYDLVKGPVANDNVYETLTLFEDGIISKEEAIVRLRTYKLVDQVFFHSAEALRFLKYVGAERVA